MDEFFLPYQKAWILDNSRIKLMEKSRQIGMSWTCAYELVRRHCQSAQKYDSWVSSRDELQAKLFIDDCKKFASILNTAVIDISGTSTLGANDSHSLEFANGTRIWSLSSNPDAQAGKRGTRVLDEFALHPDPEKLYAIAYPGITWGGNLEIISTHRGSDNFFYKLVEEARFGGNPKNISLHRITLQDALEQGLLRKLKKILPPDSPVAEMDESQYFDFIKNSCADEESFLQEYMCQPADEKSAFIAYDDIRRCVYKESEQWQNFSDENSKLYLGVDVGRTHDLSVFWLLEKCADVFYTRDIKVFKDTSFSEQEIHLHSYLRNPRLCRVAIDQSGLGRQFAERAIERYGTTRVEGVSFTQASKEMLAYPLRTAFENTSIRIPNDVDVIADLHAVKRETTNNGTIRFKAERTTDGHSDRFWALALALYAGRESHFQFVFEQIQAKKRDFIW
ncbi:MAG: terminase family protein [Opitutales bacterium]|nr:terminase family protein [Opitutales bacterium]